MSTVVEFRRRQEGAARARLLPSTDGNVPEGTPMPPSGEHIAEIFLLPKKGRAQARPKRKTLKRRLAPKPAVAALT